MLLFAHEKGLQLFSISVRTVSELPETPQL